LLDGRRQSNGLSSAANLLDAQKLISTNPAMTNRQSPVWRPRYAFMSLPPRIEAD
jgi:hypothetical protein